MTGHTPDTDLVPDVQFNRPNVDEIKSRTLGLVAGIAEQNAHDSETDTSDQSMLVAFNTFMNNLRRISSRNYEFARDYYADKIKIPNSDSIAIMNEVMTLFAEATTSPRDEVA